MDDFRGISMDTSMDVDASTGTHASTGPTATNLAALQAWFLEHQGKLHPALSFASASSASHGAHVAISPGAGAIAPMTTLLHAPFKISISIFSVPHIAPFWPTSFLDALSGSPQVVVRFAVMEAWLQRERSFWWPYLRAVPQPKQEDGEDPFDTPLYWSQDDRTWLKGSRLDAAATEREVLWRREFEQGLSAMRDADIPAADREAWQKAQVVMWEAYTWPLYLWATTLLTSRSFPSNLLMAFHTGWTDESNWGRSMIALALRRRQSTQSLPKSPVLFPGFDLTNHNPRARIRWEVNAEDVQVITHDKLQGGSECFNNYGPKSNDELLMGYGFVLENNEDDTVSFSANTRPSHSHESSDDPLGIEKGRANSSVEPVESADVSSHEGTTEKIAVLSETRALRRIGAQEQKVSFHEVLRGALSLTQAHDLALQIANKRELRNLQERRLVSDYLPSSPTRNVCMLVDQTILALRRYLDKLIQDTPRDTPVNHRQRMAATFWLGQTQIVEGNVEQLEAFLFGLQKDGYIITLSQILTNEHISPDSRRMPLRAILENCCQSKPKVKTVTENSLLEFAYVIWFCLLWFDNEGASEIQRPETCADECQRLKDWLVFIDKNYHEDLRKNNVQHNTASTEGVVVDHLVDESAKRYLQLVKTYASDASNLHADVFQDPRWSFEIIAAAVKVTREERVAFESMERIVFNGIDEIDEPFLFIEEST